MSAKLAMNMDSDRKSFYAYVRSCSKAKSTVGPLVNDNGVTTFLPKDLADKFNNYFTSAFTVEDASNIPVVESAFHGAETDTRNLSLCSRDVRKLKAVPVQ